MLACTDINITNWKIDPKYAIVLHACLVQSANQLVRSPLCQPTLFTQNSEINSCCIYGHINNLFEKAQNKGSWSLSTLPVLQTGCMGIPGCVNLSQHRRRAFPLAECSLPWSSLI